MEKTLSKLGLTAAVVIAVIQTTLAGNWTNFSNFTKPTGVAVKGNDVWVSAKGGLLQYNRTTGAKTFHTKISGALPSLSVEAVAVNQLNGDIWIGTYDNGIAMYNGTAWTKVALPANSGTVYTLKVANDGAVWVLATEGFYRYKNGAFSSYLAGQEPWDFDFLPNGKLLCGRSVPFLFDPVTSAITQMPTVAFAYATSRVAVLDDHHFSFSSDHNLVAEFTDTVEVDTFEISPAQSMKYDSAGHLFILGEDGLLYKKTTGFTTISFGGKTLTAFGFGANGELWAGASDDHCELIEHTVSNQNNVTDLRKSPLSGNRIHNICGADGGTVLISSEESIQRFDVGASQFTQEWKDSLPFTYNEAIEVNGKIFVGTSSNYLYEWKNNSWVQHGNGILPHPEVRHMTKDNAGNLWMCGYGYIAKYDGTNFTVYGPSYDYHLTQYIRGIHVDETHNNIWFCSYDGIFKLHNNTVSFYNDSTPGFQQYYDAIECISEDAQHNIWFGSVYGAVLKYDGTNFSTMLLPYHVGNQFVTGIQFSGATMYVSDNLNTLWKYENSAWDSINIRNSAASSVNVSTLYIDQEFNLWLGTYDNGIDVYNKNGVTVSRVAEVPVVEAKVYPNPSTGIFILQLPGEENAEVQIFAIDGRSIFHEEIESAGRIDLSAAPTGIYLAEIKTQRGVAKVKLARE